MSDFEKVKAALNIKQTILDMTGLKMAGPHLEQCPLCGGHKCFSIVEKDQYFKCHQCGKGGDVLTFIEWYKDVPAGDALRMGAEMAGVTLTPKAGPSASVGMKSKEKDQAPTVTERIWESAAEYYHAKMLENGGREYFIKKRGHTERTLATLKVGLADGGLLVHLKEQGFTEEQAVASGLVTTERKKGQTLDLFFEGLAVYPHYLNGRVTHFTCKDTVDRPDGKKYVLQLPAKLRSEQWTFYHQDALYKRQEIIVVEGENDLQSVMDAGADNVIGLIGQPSDQQIKALKAHTSKKHVYLCLDTDGPGVKYTRKIYQSLEGEDVHVKVVVFEGAKDIDEYLREFKGNRNQEIKRLQLEAQDPLSWEIYLAGQLTDLEAKDAHLREQGVYKAIAEMSDINLDIYTDKLVQLGFSKDAVKKVVEAENNLLTVVTEYQARIGKLGSHHVHNLAEIIYKWFAVRGKFFRTSDGSVYLFYRQRIYKIGANLDFNTMMGKLTRLAPGEAPGKMVWHWLECFCNDRGEPVEMMSWLHTDRERDAVYLNLNSPRNSLLKLRAGNEPEEIPNGTNEDHVLLSASAKVRPFEYLPDTSEREAFRAAKSLIFDSLACEREARYLALCWLVYFACLDFNKTRALMHFIGAASSGKTTAASLMSFLIYGQDLAGQGSSAASFSEGSQIPLLIHDNIENRDLNKNLVNFLLLGANSAPRTKRKGGSDTATVTEKVNALILITSIEPFPGDLPELITRTYSIVFERQHKQSGFVEDEVITELVKKRNLILSGLMKTVARKVLPRLSERSAWLSVLQKTYSGWNKSRTNEFLSLLLVILEAVLEYIPYYDKDSPFAKEGAKSEATTILAHWIRYQSELAHEVGTGSNSILNLLDGIVGDYEARYRLKESERPVSREEMDGKDCFVMYHEEYQLEVLKSVAEECTVEDEDGERPGSVKYIQFEGTAGELHRAMSRYCKNSASRNPYPNATALGCRIANDARTIERGGWQLVGRDGELFFKKVHNNKVYRFRKKLVF